MTIKRVCVFCGSKHGVRPGYTEAARSLGRVLVSKQIGLVYGGGTVGLMGELALTVQVSGCLFAGWCVGGVGGLVGGSCVGCGLADTVQVVWVVLWGVGVCWLGGRAGV
jgi:hypothetical protein